MKRRRSFGLSVTVTAPVDVATTSTTPDLLVAAQPSQDTEKPVGKDVVGTRTTVGAVTDGAGV